MLQIRKYLNFQGYLMHVAIPINCKLLLDEVSLPYDIKFFIAFPLTFTS